MKGIRARNNYYFLDFYYQNIRYRVSTTLPDTPENFNKAVKIRNMLLVDLERHQFYIENYKFKIQNINVLAKLDADYEDTKNNVLINYLLENQMKRYQQMVDAGTMAQSTIDGYQYATKKYIVPYFKDKLIQDVDAAMLEDLISKLQLTRNRIKLTLRPLKEVLKKAKKAGIITINPMDELDQEIFKTFSYTSNYKIAPFTQDEIKLILQHCKHDTIRNIIQTGFNTGMRIGELFALTWSDVDMINEIIRVNKAASIKGIIKSPKTASGIRNIEMTPKAKEAIQLQYEITGKDNDRVFKSPEGHNWIKLSWFGEYWRAALKRAGVEYRNPYQMRHTFISHMLLLGNSPMVLYPMVGHTNAQIIYQVYGKFVANSGRKILKTE
jgi:integrase